MNKSKEFEYNGVVINGFAMLFFQLIALGILGYAVWYLCEIALNPLLLGLTIAGFIVTLFLWFGFVKLDPNEAYVVLFFGKYRGTMTRNGFFWINPFTGAHALSLRARNLDATPIKVNDKMGNPVMIGLMLVWRLKDTYRAMFEIDAQTMAVTEGAVMNSKANVMLAFESFVKVQSDAALREVAGHYAYDIDEEDPNAVTLRSGGKEIVDELEQKLGERLEMAGIEVVEARINYLAYAPEIAAVMLRRQQAGAIVAAREQIVEGAVSMVKLALDRLESDGIVHLEDAQKATLVSNLMVVLCNEEAAQPVVNAGA